jgi:xanthine dehydrogenase YagR molybdenum-binding subunit
MTAQSRIDARLKVTGGARYAGDLQASDADGPLLHAAVVQSTISSGSLVCIDVDAVMEAPGVRGVLTWRNAPRLKPVTTLMSTELDHLLPLQNPSVHYKGQAIALVIADAPLDAQYAASLVTAEYKHEGSEPELSFQERIPTAAEAKKVGAGEGGKVKRGRPEADFARSPIRLDRTY